jgi:hypothetical protein
MKFLTGHATPKLTITHRTRRQTITRTGQMILTESTLKLELTLPSFVTGVRQSWRNLKDDFNRFVRDIFVPNLAHYCAVA